MDWPKGITQWIDNRTLHLSIPFTWLLPEARGVLLQRAFDWDAAIVGGSATRLMPDYLADLPHVTVGNDMPGVLQRVNPLATKTTTGCVRHCGFCGVPIIEGDLVELADWPDLPIICDNNLLAASDAHFERVIERLQRHGWADFNQGLDMRLLTPARAKAIVSIGKPVVRLALDANGDKARQQWQDALTILLEAGQPKSRILSYCLVGFRGEPQEDFDRCLWVEKRGVKALPQWFHDLDTLEHNAVTTGQAAMGWNDQKRQDVMGFFYKHRKPVELRLSN